MQDSNICKIKSLLETYPKYKKNLFIRGYLVTNDNMYSDSDFPFYSNWKDYKFGNYNFIVHNQQNLFFHGNDNKNVVLIGNCVNPFSLEYCEESIVKKIFMLINNGIEDAITYINELTGCFVIFYVDSDKISFLSDPAGMLYCCYANFDDKIYISSHVQLIADLYKFEKDDYIKKLEKYKYFYKYGLFFPGDLTQYKGIKRILQNHIFSYDKNEVKFLRFYPAKELKLCQDENEYTKLVQDVCNILKNTMNCVAQKWKKPAISLTGGMDSKTTLASANGIYDKFEYYSYITMNGDKIDADAAHKIAKHLNIKHKIFNISENDSDFSDIKIVRTIIQHNNGDYKINNNDVRKRLFFSENFPYDVEVKSWVSEVARANYYKKFGFKKMPRNLSPRNMTSMYKVFLYQRKLAVLTDKVFKDFIIKAKFYDFPEGYDSSDMYLWEFRYSAWGGQAITSEHLFSNDIFIPYNNRKLLDLMLRAPLEKRISDEFHEDLIKNGNKNISDTNITITNWNETRSRMYIEKMYYLINSHII